MKKREMMQAVRRVHPEASAEFATNSTGWDIRVSMYGGQVLGTGYTEYTAWADAWQRLVRRAGVVPQRAGEALTMQLMELQGEIKRALILAGVPQSVAHTAAAEAVHRVATSPVASGAHRTAYASPT